MAIKRTVNFKLNFRGDGSSASVNFPLVLGPYWFTPYSGGDIIQPTFDLGALKPTDVQDVSVNTGLGVSSASITTLGTILAVTFDSAPTDGSLYTLFGTFVF